MVVRVFIINMNSNEITIRVTTRYLKYRIFREVFIMEKFKLKLQAYLWFRKFDWTWQYESIGLIVKKLIDLYSLEGKFQEIWPNLEFLPVYSCDS